MYRRSSCPLPFAAVLAFALAVLAAAPAAAFNEGPAQPLPGPGPFVEHEIPCLITCPFLPPAIGGVPSFLTPLGDLLFYAAGDDEHGGEPWVSDGTFEGTGLLADLCEGECSSNPVPVAVVPARPDRGPELVFWGRTREAGQKVWITDGTPAGTRLLADPCPGSECGPSPVTFWLDMFEDPWLDAGETVGDRVVFGAYTDRGALLYASDGTVAGTGEVVRLCPAGSPAGCSGPPHWFSPAAGGERVYFVVDAPSRDRLWVSDGTAAGTQEVDLACPAGTTPTLGGAPVPFRDGVALRRGCGNAGSSPPELMFHAGDGPATPLGVDAVRAVAVVGDRLFAVRAVAGGDSPAAELWVAEGTPPTVRKTLDLEVDPGAPTLGLEAAAGRLFLVVGDGSYRADLLVTDGSTPPVRVNQAPSSVLTPFSEAQGRALWWERPDRFDPEIYEWWLVSYDPGEGRRREQVFGSPTVGPDLETRILDVEPSHRQVGDELFLRAQAGGGNQLWHFATEEIVPTCFDDPEALCLQDGRFQVKVRYVDRHNGGQGLATPDAASRQFARETGYLWFFRPDNLELAVKVLDGRPVNGHWWVFSGGTTDLEYELDVVDLETDRVRTYRHAPGDLCSVVDTAAFREGPTASPAAIAPASMAPVTTALGSIAPASEASAPPPTPAASPLTPPPPPECDFFSDRLACVGPGDRFSIRVDYANQHAGGETGPGFAFPETADTATVRFFPNGGTELLVKVLDGRPVNGHWWVLWGGLTDLGYTLRVLDRETEEVRTFTNPVGSTCGGAATTAFAEAP